MPLLLAVEVI